MLLKFERAAARPDGHCRRGRGRGTPGVASEAALAKRGRPPIGNHSDMQLRHRHYPQVHLLGNARGNCDTFCGVPTAVEKPQVVFLSWL
jgi:hypothetical protein